MKKIERQKESYERKLIKLQESNARVLRRAQRRLELAKGKAKLKSLPALKEELQTVTNRIVRHKYPVCYTCGDHLEFKDRQAGHHWSRGKTSATRFDFENIRTQCVRCNMYGSGEQGIFERKLQEELGKERCDALYLRSNQKKIWERSELEQMIAERKLILKQLEDGQ